jgi:hypothetical protein
VSVYLTSVSASQLDFHVSFFRDPLVALTLLQYSISESFLKSPDLENKSSSFEDSFVFRLASFVFVEEHQSIEMLKFQNQASERAER